MNPAYTVLYNIVTDNSPWIGRGWEFFDDQYDAMRRYEKLIEQGHCPTLRPFNENCDRKNMGAAHQLHVSEATNEQKS